MWDIVGQSKGLLTCRAIYSMLVDMFLRTLAAQ